MMLIIIILQGSWTNGGQSMLLMVHPWNSSCVNCLVLFLFLFPYCLTLLLSYFYSYFHNNNNNNNNNNNTENNNKVKCTLCGSWWMG